MSVARALPLVLAGLALAPATLAARAATPTVPTAPSTPDASVRAAVAEFVAALNALDAERAGRAFADDATMFFPGAPFPAARVQGRPAIAGAFGQVFAALRQRGARRGNVAPRGLEVQLHGEVAIATFHLAGGQELGRRTLVLRRAAGRWLIAHMHGSAARLQTPAAAQPAPAPARPSGR